MKWWYPVTVTFWPQSLRFRPHTGVRKTKNCVFLNLWPVRFKVWVKKRYWVGFFPRLLEDFRRKWQKRKTDRLLTW